MGAGSIVEMMEESKSTRTSRVAFALLCGLAVCCSVMYITSDGAEVVLASEEHVGSGQDIYDPKSVDSFDVMKTGLLYTKTPDTLKKSPEGRERLLTFLEKIEANIAKEVQSRKEDIEAIRARMAKNMQFNVEARKKMKTMLLAKMAVNAKIAKDDLAAAMRKTQKEFADAAALENQRWRKNNKRFKKTRAIMKRNKKQAARDLKAATAAQQRALATLAAQTNAKIKKNAKKAREDLDNAMDAFNNKMANVEEEAKKGRSKLAALQDKRFSQTVADIAEAKKEANDRVEGFKTSFNADIMALSEKCEQQTKQLNQRQNQLAATVQSNKLEQAKVNNNVNAELKRMIKVGNDRYAEHLKKDAELKDLMAKNKEREHAENSLSTATSALYKTMADNQEAQEAVN